MPYTCNPNYTYDKRIHRKWVFGPGQRMTMNIAFAPLYKGKGGQLLSLEQGLLLQRYKAALDGNVAALSEFLGMIRRNDQARDKQMRELNWGIVYAYYQTVPARPAMLLLLRIGHLVKRDREDDFLLDQWVAELASERFGPFSERQWSKLRATHLCNPDDLDNVVPYRLEDDPDYTAGPPKRPAGSTRFQKGRSGNPRGRPRKRRGQTDFKLPFGGFLEQTTVVTIDGVARVMTRAEVLIYQAGLRALKGSLTIAGLLARHTSRVREERFNNPIQGPTLIIYSEDSDDLPETSPRAVSSSEEKCDLHLFAPRCRKFRLLQPWIVEAAVHRLAPDTLSEAEQKVVVRATSKPETVKWPEWWSPHLRKRFAVKPGEPRVRTVRTET